jgi:hypothetical protein
LDELENIEQQRIRVFALVGFTVFFALFIWRQHALLAVLTAVSVGLFVSGWYVAARMTQSHNWAFIEAEARQKGGAPSKRRVWLGNVAPGVLIGLGSLWWLNAA